MSDTETYPLVLSPIAFWILFYPYGLFFAVIIVLLTIFYIIVPIFVQKFWGYYYEISLISIIFELFCIIIPSLSETYAPFTSSGDIEIYFLFFKILEI